MTTVEWLAFFVLLVSALAAAVAVTLSNGAVTRAIRRLERTYRRQKSLELEQLHEQLVTQRRAELAQVLSGPDGWRKVLDQLLADALSETDARIGQAGVLDLNTSPVPRFTVAGTDGRSYLLTTSPEALQAVGILGRKEQAVALDAALHPAARLEAQAVWEHLATQRLQDPTSLLPRQAPWFLVVREARRMR